GDGDRQPWRGPWDAEPRTCAEVPGAARRRSGRYTRLEGQGLQLGLPVRDPDRNCQRRDQQRGRPLLERAGAALRRFRLAAVGAGVDSEDPQPPVSVSLLEPAKAALLIFVAAILQVTVFSQIDILGGYPDVVLLTLMAIALLRGSIYGAVLGFFAGLIVDTANLGTLGVASLLLTIAGYWIGRYGETTGRDRVHAP